MSEAEVIRVELEKLERLHAQIMRAQVANLEHRTTVGSAVMPAIVLFQSLAKGHATVSQLVEAWFSYGRVADLPKQPAGAPFRDAIAELEDAVIIAREVLERRGIPAETLLPPL